MQSFDPERDIELTELDMAEVLDHCAARQPRARQRSLRADRHRRFDVSAVPAWAPGDRQSASACVDRR
jgi:hypothetical protein